MVLHISQRRQMQRPLLGRASMLIALVLLLTMTGCSAVEVHEAPGEHVHVTELVGEAPERDLAVSGLEIDPDLSRAIGLPGGSTNFRLLATVENRGRVDESEVLVEAWLRAPAGHGGMVLMQGAEVVPSLPAGESQVVQLDASGVVPILTSYVLEVSVRPARQEQYLGNNVAQYEITVSATDAPLG